MHVLLFFANILERPVRCKRPDCTDLQRLPVQQAGKAPRYTTVAPYDQYEVFKRSNSPESARKTRTVRVVKSHASFYRDTIVHVGGWGMAWNSARWLGRAVLPILARSCASEVATTPFCVSACSLVAMLRSLLCR